MQQSIKDNLVGKEVNVRLGDGSIVKGNITGRLMDFAHVSWQDKNCNLGVEVAWETLVNCFNNNRPVSI